MKKNIILEGNHVYLEEICPKYFTKVIEWRNNPEFNKFLNQPYKLTVELQDKWYDQYLQDDTQGLLVLIDKKNNIPFGTMGWTNLDRVQKICITGRLLIGNLEYRGSSYFKEAAKIFNDFLYKECNVEIMYAHVVEDNIASIKWHKKWGYCINSNFKYPEEMIVNGMKQIEFYRSFDDYIKSIK